METIKHRDYIKKKELVIKNLPTGVQDKIAIFKKMKTLEQSTADEDQSELENELMDLDIEIHTDLKEVVKSYKEKEVEFRQPKADTIAKPEVTLSGDEAILEKFYKQYKDYEIKRSTLKEWGIKRAIKDGMIIGKYRLERVSFLFYRYQIQIV